MQRREVFEEINAARVKADFKWGREAGMWGSSQDRKLTVLMEEVGEVARAILEGDLSGQRAELIDVLQVATAWLESDFEVPLA